MNINGRLLLLVVVIGLFVRVWKTNEHPRSRPVERSRSQAAEKVVAPAIAAAETALPAAPISDRRDRHERPTIEEHWTAATCPIPLPAGITTGTYRVINDTGRVAKLIVAAEDVSKPDASAPVAATEMLMTVVGGGSLVSDSSAIGNNGGSIRRPAAGAREYRPTFRMRCRAPRESAGSESEVRLQRVRCSSSHPRGHDRSRSNRTGIAPEPARDAVAAVNL